MSVPENVNAILVLVPPVRRAEATALLSDLIVAVQREVEGERAA